MFSSYAKKRFLFSCVRVLYNLKVDASSHNIATSHAIYRKHVNGQYQCLFQASLGGRFLPPKKLTTPLNVNLQPPLNDILGQLSLASLRGRLIEYQLWLG